MRWPRWVDKLKNLIGRETDGAEGMADKQGVADIFFTIQPTAEPIPLKQISALIIQSPWTALSELPKVKRNDKGEVEVSFLALNEKQGNLMREQIEGCY